MIQQIVARRNRGEHLPDCLGRRLAVPGTCGSCSYDPLICLFIHLTVAVGRPRRSYCWTGEAPVAPLINLISCQFPDLVDG